MSFKQSQNTRANQTMTTQSDYDHRFFLSTDSEVSILLWSVVAMVSGSTDLEHLQRKVGMVLNSCQIGNLYGIRSSGPLVLALEYCSEIHVHYGIRPYYSYRAKDFSPLRVSSRR